MKRLSATLALCLLFILPAVAQQPATTPPTTTFQYGGGPVGTFSASPTDWLTITGSSSKKVSVTAIDICGHVGSGMAPTTVPISLILRSTTNTGGTSANQTGANLSGSASTPTATVTIYTANPTLGTTTATINVKPLSIGPPGADGCIFFQYGPQTGSGPVVIPAGRLLAVNLQGQPPPSGLSLVSTVTVTEQ